MAVLIKNVSETTWRQFKAEAAQRGITVGELFNNMVRAYMSETRQADNAWKKILDGKPLLSNEDAIEMKASVKEFREGFSFEKTRS